jgi:predicted transcriptional regulator YdeE
MSVYEEQKKTKPSVESIIPGYLSGEKERLARDFIAYLRAEKLNPVWASADSWKCGYKNKGVCYVRLRDGYFSVSPYVDYTKDFEAFAAAENFTGMIWKNLAFCRRCNPKSCAARCNEDESTFRGVKKTFLGKEFDNICVGGGDAHFHDPGDAEIACIKKLIGYRRRAIDNNSVQKVKYMAIKKRIDKIEIITLDSEIKVVGLSLEKAGWAKRVEKIGELWGVYSDGHRMKTSAAIPVVEYGFWIEKSGDYDYIAGSAVTEFGDTGDEQISYAIPAGRYIRHTFNAFDFGDLVEVALQKSGAAVPAWAKENGYVIKRMPPFPVAGIEVYPVQEMVKPEGGATNGTFKRDARIKSKYPAMYTLTPVE